MKYYFMKKTLLLQKVDSFGKIMRIVPKKLTQNDNRNDFLFGTKSLAKSTQAWIIPAILKLGVSTLLRVANFQNRVAKI